MKRFPWNPFRRIERANNQIDNFFDEIIDTCENSLFNNSLLNEFLQFELQDSKKNLIIKINIPTLSPKDLNVQISQDAICVSAEISHRGSGVFHYEKLQKIIKLPTLIDNEAATADWNDSAIILNLPKLQVNKSKVVKLNVNKSEEILPSIEPPQVIDVPVQKA